MAAPIFRQNTYAGEVLNDILAYSAQGNDTYRHGLIYIKSGIQFKYVIPRIELDEIIQDRKPTPVSPTDSKGQYTFSERYLEPQDYMVYLEFNPRDYEKYWKQWQPEDNLVFRDLDPTLQAKFLQELMKRKNEYIGHAIWKSVKGAGGVTGDATVTPPSGESVLGAGLYKYYDGVIKRILTNLKDAVVGDTVILAGSTVLADGEAVETALYTMWEKTPAHLRDKALTYVMSWDLWDKYEKYLTTKHDYKYTDNTKLNQLMFKGKRVLPIVGVTNQTIVLAHFTNDQDSNLWMGVDFSNDEEVIKIDRLQANSELYFFKMLLKTDVNIVKPAEMIVWTAYKNV